jgi:membrane protease YdiL (CAAX protease family)
MLEREVNERRLRCVVEALSASAGMVLFAIFSHQALPWTIASAAGLLVTAIAIEQSIRSATSIAGLVGLSQFSHRGVLFTAVGFSVGIGFGVLYRISQGMPVFPAGGVEAFVAVACLIGTAEELVYRGWVQGRLRVLGWLAAVVLAAFAHTAYKTALFAWPPEPMDINYPFVALWTFVGGIIFSLIRELSGSVIPPMLAHGMFDLLVYGAVTRAPWWVWT